MNGSRQVPAYFFAQWFQLLTQRSQLHKSFNTTYSLNIYRKLTRAWVRFFCFSHGLLSIDVDLNSCKCFRQEAWGTFEATTYFLDCLFLSLYMQRVKFYDVILLVARRLIWIKGSFEFHLMNSSIDIVLERTSILTPLFFLTIECKFTLLDILQESLCSLLFIAVT